jgi:EAL domain-containing protein (putative c-di-GMP-specific phosphodiesterase class I)
MEHPIMPDGSHSFITHNGIINELTQALACGGLSLHYQPQYDLFRRRITGVEALIRWPRPGFPPIGPDVFIPIAEKEGLIVALGDWVLKEACRQAVLWRHQGIDLTIAVNVSPLQFAPEAGLENAIHAALSAAQLPAHRLEIEVTEGVLLSSNARDTLNRLIGAGLSVALDDFGTGYSSLAYLKNLRASTLKIDKSFVDGLPSSLEDCMLIDAVARLAHSFGMSVVAEGVENQDQQDVLELMGCDIIQGYVLSPALPAALIPAYLGTQ